MPSPSLVLLLGSCPQRGASEQHGAVVLQSGLDPDPASHPSPARLAAFAGRDGRVSGQKWRIPPGGESVVATEEEFGAESIRIHNATHWGIRPHGERAAPCLGLLGKVPA